jgi:nitrous-oxide reductase
MKTFGFQSKYALLNTCFSISIAVILLILSSCGGLRQQSADGVLSNDDAAAKVYVAPGEKDAFYGFFSGGFSGQMTVYGLPSGRLFKIIPVFSQHAENGYGYNDETQPMLMTSYGFVPWDDAHHPELSQTNGETDGRYVFINANNTPRVARIDLTTFETAEIIEIPNNAGAHSAPFVTENTEYIVAGTRFSVPIPQEDMSIDASQFKGTLSFISMDPATGDMELAFQILVPGYDYDLGHCGKGPSHGWTFFTTYNTEQASTMKEVEASQHDKDFVAAVNWKKAEEYIQQGKYKEMPATYYNNYYDEKQHRAISEK